MTNEQKAGEILAQVEEGTLDAASAVNALVELGFDPSDAEDLISGPDIKAEG